ncbi:MAG: hypothetical protein ABRQ39_04255 [Candidatus Eremiobacterota bacterium]
MEEALNQILSEIKGMKGQIDCLTNEITEVKGRIDHLTKETFKISVKLEDKMDKGLQALDFKLDKIYVNTVGVSQQFTDVTKQELPVLRSRQMEHSNQLEDHEERIVKLETIE